jgi:hypothetical protein
MLARRAAMQAMKDGRHDDAIASMETLLASGSASLTDAGIIVGLSHIFASRGDIRSLRTGVRQFLGQLPSLPERRLAALRLSRTIFAHFGSDAMRHRISYRARTGNWLQRAPLKPKPKGLLFRSVTLEERLAREAPTMLDTDVSRAQCLIFAKHVRERLIERAPFSFVRVNDGEANALHYESAYASHFDSDAAEREQVWWGRTFPPPARREMSAKVAQAIWNADAIGIPTFGRILRDVHLADDDDFTLRRSGRGLAAGVAAFEQWRELRPASLAPPLFTSANLQQDLQRWNVYPELFDGLRDVVLVSGHENLPDTMKRLFNIGLAAFVPVVPGDASLHLRNAEEKRTLPDVLDDVITEVEARARGRMVIVGAGYLGKWIVHRAKVAGGVALDLGSALDYWMGFKTRSYQDLA